MSTTEFRLLWENRENGAYLTVPSEAPPGFFNVESIVHSLVEDHVLNFDRFRIQEVLNNPSGRPELVGPPFVRFDNAKRQFVFLNVQPLEVRILVRSSLRTAALRLTKEDLVFLLLEGRVVHGILWSVVDQLLTGELDDKDTVVAKADFPVRGKDAEIHEQVPIDPDARPVLLEDGNVDYRNLENIRQIAENVLIAKRLPPTEGVAGRDVLGRILPAEPGKDKFLPKGENTRICPEAVNLYSETSGYLYRKMGLIHVGRLFVVREDVSFKTGNIDYCGDVLIRGNVLTDFKVIAEGQITVEGLVEGAEIISRQGSILVRRGVFGKGKAKLHAAQDISVAMAQDAVFCTPATLKVVKYMRGCKLDVGNISAETPGCVVSGCDIQITGQAFFAQLGNTGGGVNRIRLSQKAGVELHEKVEELDLLAHKMAQVLQGMEAKLSQIKLQLKNAALGDTALRGEYQNWYNQYQMAKKKAELVQEKRKQMLRELDVPPDRLEIVKAKKLEPVLEVFFHGEELPLRQAISLVAIGWRAGSICVEGH